MLIFYQEPPRHSLLNIFLKKFDVYFDQQIKQLFF